MRNVYEKCGRGAALIAAALITGVLIRCAGTGDMASRGLLRKVTDENQAAGENRILMAGSTSMEKFANILAESFMDDHPGTIVTAEFTGSSAGIEAVLSGRADMGISSRELTRKESAAGAVGRIIAIDGIAVVTDTANPVTELTVEQLADIYTGKIRNWKEAGGIEEPVVVTGREAGSGTRSTFERLLGLKDLCRYANEMNSEGAVMARIMSTPGAIGYVSFAVRNDSVHALAINGAEATEDNVKAGRYPLSRPFLLVTKGEISRQRESVQEILNYLYSEKGEQLIRMAGLIVPE